ncbi:MAG: lysophospholipid acyltransferase family protein [Betaproteobacteria bacterium]|nr:lysophospholipid acyltransferase family protein [Betaproteobacteria bacterium]
MPNAGRPVLRLLLRFLAWLDLPANHRLGAVAGRLVFLLSPRFRLRTLENLRTAAIAADDAALARLARENAAEIGKGAAELAWALFRPVEDVSGLVKELVGWDTVERLRAEGRPLIFVTPHLGSYDIAGRYLWSRLPIMAMYRPHKLGWLDELIREGRNRGAAPDGSNVAPATMAGVRMLLRHLRKGGCTVILPDQVPGEGEGEWIDFFGRPAYTMTLTGRLQEASGAVIVYCFAERLADSRGFRLHLQVSEAPLPAERSAAALAVNRGVEALIRMAPAQYLWGYNRYKRPAGAPPAPGAMRW